MRIVFQFGGEGWFFFLGRVRIRKGGSSLSHKPLGDAPLRRNKSYVCGGRQFAGIHLYRENEKIHLWTWHYDSLVDRQLGHINPCVCWSKQNARTRLYFTGVGVNVIWVKTFDDQSYW